MEVSVISLLLLLLHTQCCESTSDINVMAESLCKELICHVSVDIFEKLQQIISSNRLIVLDEVEFSVNGKNDFIQIQNVSNLTISGGESGSVIECSPQSTFGLHLRNSTNVTLTGIRIRNCGCPINEYVIFDIAITAISVLIEASANVNLSRFDIENSPGVGLALIDLSPDHYSEIPFFVSGSNMNPNLTLNDCNISYSREGSIVAYGNTSLLVERTVIAHSAVGLASYMTDVMMRNIDVFNCDYSYLEGRSAVVREKLTMNQSSLYVTDQELFITGRVLFTENVLMPALSGIRCKIVISENSVVLVTRCTPSYMQSFAVYLENSDFRLEMNSTLIFTNNRATNSSALMILFFTRLSINESSLILHHNFMEFESSALMCVQSIVNGNRGTFIIKENMCYNSSVLFGVSRRVTELTNGSVLYLVRNELYDSSSILISTGSIWNTSPDSELIVTDNVVFGGFSVFFTGNVSFGGLVRVADNNVSHYGALNIFDSQVDFDGALEVEGNRAESGGVTAYNSEIVITDRATFTDNHAPNGGAMTLISSFLYVSLNASVSFARNQADELGGAIYITKPRQMYMCDVIAGTPPTCSIQILSPTVPTCQTFSITFDQNKAGTAGNAIYGGQTLACMPGGYYCYSKCIFPNITDIYHYNGVNDSSDLSDFTSDPTRVCLCENGNPNCYKVENSIAVYPGENFNISLALVGYGLGTVPGSVIARGRGINDISDGILSSSGHRQTLLGSQLE